MTDFTESDLRITAFNHALETYELAEKTCADLAETAQRAVNMLRAPITLPAQAQRKLAPPPMPHETRQQTAITFPTQAQIDDVIAARITAVQAMLAAWDALTGKEQRTRVHPPKGWNLRFKDSN